MEASREFLSCWCGKWGSGKCSKTPAVCIKYARVDVRNLHPPLANPKRLGKNILLSLTRYQKHLMQSAARNSGDISNNFVHKQPELCGKDTGLRGEAELMRSSFSEWTVPLKSFSSRLLVFILHCRRLSLPGRRGGRKREVNAVLKLGFWSGDQSSNRIFYQRHIIHLSALASVTETWSYIRAELP